MTKDVKVIGYAPLLDEADCLEGWIKNIRLYCEEIYCLYDPRSTDNTLNLLEGYVEKYKDSECPVYIWVQDPNRGDSYRGHIGPKKEMCYRANVNVFLEEKVPMDSWSMWLAADERLNPHELDRCNEFLLYADYMGLDSLVFDIYDCFPDINHYANYYAIYKRGLWHRKMVRRTPQYKYNLTPHSGYFGGDKKLQTKLQFFHFGHIKKEDPYLNWWRHGNGLDVLLRLPEDQRFLEIDNPFKDWKRGILKEEIKNGK